MSSLEPPRHPPARLHAALCVLGIALSMLLWSMQSPASGLAESLCTAGPRVSCSDVLASAWGKVRGLPVSALGAAYFAFLLAWFAVIGLPNRAGRGWHLVPTAAVLCGAALSAQLVGVMATQLRVWCPWCVAVHAVNLLLLAATLGSWRSISRRHGPDRWLGGGNRAAMVSPATSAPVEGGPPSASVAAPASYPIEPQPPAAAAYPGAGRAAAVLLVSASLMTAAFAGVMALAFQVQATAWRAEWLKSVNTVEYAAWRWSSSPKVDIPIRPDDLIRGPADAAHTAVVFSDFQCPQCRTLDKLLSDAAEKSGGRLRIVFKHFPLCGDCNPQMKPRQGCAHRRACAAAEAAEAAREIAGVAAAVQLGQRLFESSDLGDAALARMAAEAGIDSARFAEALRKADVRRRIEEDVALAGSLGVRGSGTLFVDGRQLAVWRLVQPQDPMQTDEAATRRLWERVLR